jgi:hypothetical protein
MLAGRYLGAGDAQLGLALPVLALVGGLALLHAGTVRFRRLSAVLHAAGPAPAGPVMPGALMLGAITLMGMLIGVVSAVFVIATALSRGP